MLPPDRCTAIARHSQWLAVALESLVLISLLACAVPLAAAKPAWRLRPSDAAVNLAPILLLAVMVLRLGDVLLDGDADEALSLALVRHRQPAQPPDQSGGKRRRRPAQPHRPSSSESELRSLLTAKLLPPLQGGSLAERKQQLSEAITINTSRISSSLRDQRAETLRTSLPGTLRVLVGAAIVSAFLFSLRR
jgi:hypothetical protein